MFGYHIIVVHAGHASFRGRRHGEAGAATQAVHGGDKTSQRNAGGLLSVAEQNPANG